MVEVRLAAFPTADVLMGKVHLPNAVRRFFAGRDAAAQADAAARVTFLAGSVADLDAFAALATELGVRLQVVIEIDVGLRRSGLRDPSELPALLDRLRGESALALRGLLGYDGHVAFAPRGNVEGVMSAFEGATVELQAFVDALDLSLVSGEPIFHSGGSTTYPLYAGSRTPVNDVATGGGVLRPGEYPDHVISDLLPAIFVATPVLKQYDEPWLPFFDERSGPVLRGQQGLSIYGGGGSSTWVYPEDIGGAPLVSDVGAAPPLVPNRGQNWPRSTRPRPDRHREAEYALGVRGAFRIVDPECLAVLAALGRAFDHAGLAYAVAGGMGVQALLAAERLDHLLRRTGDIDVLVLGDDALVVRALNELARAQPSLPVIQNPAAKNARVGPMNVDWINEPSRLRGMEHAFRGSIENARSVQVRGLVVPVQEPEVLLAAKLTGQKVRPQDELDIAGLVQARTPIDEARVRALVESKAGRFDVFLAIKMDVLQS